MRKPSEVLQLLGSLCSLAQCHFHSAVVLLDWVCCMCFYQGDESTRASPGVYAHTRASVILTWPPQAPFCPCFTWNCALWYHCSFLIGPTAPCNFLVTIAYSSHPHALGCALQWPMSLIKVRNLEEWQKSSVLEDAHWLTRAWILFADGICQPTQGFFAFPKRFLSMLKIKGSMQNPDL